MRPPTAVSAFLLTCIIFFTSCDNSNKKKDVKEQPAAVADAPAVPAIDIASLKDEASLLAAMQQVVDARVADEKKQKENPKYSGSYLELTRLYTAVLKAANEYSHTIGDPAKALEFNNKISAIQDQMYGKQ